jgi:hypothetical protein
MRGGAPTLWSPRFHFRLPGALDPSGGILAFKGVKFISLLSTAHESICTEGPWLPSLSLLEAAQHYYLEWSLISMLVYPREAW